MDRLPRAVLSLATAAWRVSFALLVLIGCSEHSPTAPVHRQMSSRLIVSAPQAQATALLASHAAQGGDGISLHNQIANDNMLVYVSLPPGSVPSGDSASIRNLATRQMLVVAMSDGGFDPVPLIATADDTLALKIRSPDTVIAPEFATVPHRRPPTLVRTNPPKGKTDVPLNAQIIVVFSEPVDPLTVVGSVRLLVGNTIVAGTVTLSPSGLVAVFAPDAALAAHTAYELVVDSSVRNLSGDALASAASVSFTTGVASAPPASLLVSGLPCQIIVTARDALGNFAATYTGTVHFTTTDPAVVLPNDYTFVSADKGMHAFPVALKTAGSQSVTVTDVESSLSATQSVTMEPIVLDHALYVTNEGSHGVTAYTAGPLSCGTAAATTIDGSNTGLDGPGGIGIDAAGRVYVANSSSGPTPQSVSIFGANATGNVPPVATITGGTGPGTLNPRGIAVDAAGNVFVGNGDNNSVNFYAAGVTGNVPPTATIAGPSTGLAYAAGVALDAAGRIYVASFRSSSILVFAAGATGNASPVRRIAGANTGLNLPIGITLDNAGRVYLGNGGNSSITVYASDADGDAPPIATIAGSNTGLSWPRGVAVDGAGRLYVANGDNSTITVYAPGATGNVAPLTTIGGSNSGLNHPAYLAFASTNVTSPTPSAVSLVLSGLPGSVAIGQQATYVVTANDASGNILPDYRGTVHFTSTDPSAQLPASYTFTSADRGVHLFTVTFGAAGNQTLSGTDAATPSINGEGMVSVVAVPGFSAISAGVVSNCGLTADAIGYCWGENDLGRIGDGTTTDNFVPTRIAGGLHFRELRTASLQICGLTTDGTAYCWGSNLYGALGTGTVGAPQTCYSADWADEGVGYQPCSPSPLPVAGGLRFVALSSGSATVTCGLTSDGTAYCWGYNADGELGTGSSTWCYSSAEAAVVFPTVGNHPCSATPVPVAGGLHFASISSGGFHSCGVTTAGEGYCWGYNDAGQLGNGGATSRSVPGPVTGGLRFSTIGTGGAYSCGLTIDGMTYCWGSNVLGQLGDGTNVSHSAPALVTGGRRFITLSVGSTYACGLTSSGDAYCWGDAALFADGTTSSRNVPVLVSGGLHFISLSAGYGYTCGVTADGAYCWGLHGFEPLDVGTLTSSKTSARAAAKP